MGSKSDTQRTFASYDPLNSRILTQVEAFLSDRQAAGLAPGSLRFYRQKLNLLTRYCERRKLEAVGQLTADVLRAFLLELAKDHNPGGVHGAYRAARAFLRWFEAEHEPEGWRNPISRVQAPKVPQVLLDPADAGDVARMVESCKGRGLTAVRDRALLLFLVDTGVRAAELLGMDVSDLDPETGRAVIRKGKGGKGRAVFAGRKTRRALRAYLASHPGGRALWVTAQGDRLTYDGLRTVMQRRAAAAGVTAPKLHGLRRLFAVSCLRAGMSLEELRRLLGHSSLTVTQRYLKLTDSDLETAHRTAGPVDNLL